MKSKTELFPLTTRIIGKPPRREDLYWCRDHLIRMTNALETSMSPYVYMVTAVESSKLRAMVSDLNTRGDSLWPIRLTTNARISAARSALKHIRSRLHIVLKEYH